MSKTSERAYGTRKPRPTYQEVADAIAVCLDAGLYEVVLLQDGQPVDDPVLRLARALERNGLIDAAGVRAGRSADSAGIVSLDGSAYRRTKGIVARLLWGGDGSRHHEAVLVKDSPEYHYLLGVAETTNDDGVRADLRALLDLADKYGAAEVWTDE